MNFYQEYERQDFINHMKKINEDIRVAKLEQSEELYRKGNKELVKEIQALRLENNNVNDKLCALNEAVEVLIDLID